MEDDEVQFVASSPTSSSEISDPRAAIAKFRSEVIDELSPRQLFSVSRLEGSEELKRDIFLCYKGKRNKLNALPRIRFEEEEGAGSGPVREFLLCAIKMVDEGMKISSKPTIFFEGETDHRIPLHDQASRVTGSFKAIGRIIAHSALHGGPSIHGISPAIVHYLCNSAKELEDNPPPLSLNDIPDIELRKCISEVRH